MNYTVTSPQWQQIKNFALETLRFSAIAATDCDLSAYIPKFKAWLAKNYHSDLSYMTKHGHKRYTPEALVQNTKSVIMVRLNYLPERYGFKNLRQQLQHKSNIAKISYYAQGRDYHKLIRKKLAKLDDFIKQLLPLHQCRVFSDSAPVLEKPLAEKSGLGWIGKNSNLLDSEHGSFFFLGSLYSNMDFSAFSQPKQPDHCGNCTACIKACPTDAIVDGRMVDANRCISYLTIENKGSIPVEFRKKIGNRIYGCDDCQLVCPINVNAPLTDNKDFLTRQNLKAKSLVELLNWNEKQFLEYTEGSAIRRIGYIAWLRNIIIGLGNAPKSPAIIKALLQKSKSIDNPMLAEHINWAITEQKSVE